MSEDTLTVQGMEWFDAVNGNSYCSVRVHWEDKLLAVAPFQYGYGDFYKQAALEALYDASWEFSMEPRANGTSDPLWQVEIDNGFLLDNHIARGKTRSEVEAWGSEEA